MYWGTTVSKVSSLSGTSNPILASAQVMAFSDTFSAISCLFSEKIVEFNRPHISIPFLVWVVHWLVDRTADFCLMNASLNSGID